MILPISFVNISHLKQNDVRLWGESIDFNNNRDTDINFTWQNSGINISEQFSIVKYSIIDKNNNNLIKYIKIDSTLNNRSYVKFDKNIGLYSSINECID